MNDNGETMSGTPEHEKPVAFKITHGYVRQDFVDGKCVGQKFVAGDPVEWEDEIGNPIDCPGDEQYEPFDMVQPVIEIPVIGTLKEDG